MQRRIVPITIILCLNQIFLHAQVVRDSTSFIEKITGRHDTLVHNPKSGMIIKPGSGANTRNDSSISNSKKFSNDLFELILKENNGKKSSSENVNSASTTRLYEGKIIRNISVRRVDLYAPTILDTGYIKETWLKRTVNNLHTDTRRRVIERNLLVKKGDELDPLLLTENERIYRDLPYIMDARFLVKEIPHSQDSVDLVLLVKDVWPILIETELSQPSSGNFTIENQNILGLGHQLSSEIYWDLQKVPLLGYRFIYGISNVAGSFISTDIGYTNRWNTTSYMIDIHRNFRTSELKYAGEAHFEKTITVSDIPLIDTVLNNVNLNYYYGDLWLGRLFRLYNLDGEKMYANAFVAGRLFFENFTQGPVTGPQSMYNYQDKTQGFVSVGFSKQGYTKSNLIYTYGKTEDVPYGFLFNITTGMEWGQYAKRPYLGSSVSAGNFIPHNGYLYGIARYGTFFNHGVPEQSEFDLQLRYFTDLQTIERFHLRQFATITYTTGINRFPDEYLSIEDRKGITGLKSTSMRGNEKLVLNFESVVFTPYSLVGFRLAIFSSFDVGVISPESFGLEHYKVFTGLGVGIRIRNELLVFNTIELRFTLYPGYPNDATQQYFYAGTVPGLRLNDFYMNKPGIIPYD